MERRLAAILAFDMVGYSRLMEQDEAGISERLRQKRMELVEPAVSQHHGRIFKLMGEWLLADLAALWMLSNARRQSAVIAEIHLLTPFAPRGGEWRTISR
jgi:class 3 adenylate cyclase